MEHNSDIKQYIIKEELKRRLGMFNYALKKFRDNYLSMLPFILVSYIISESGIIISGREGQMINKYNPLLNGEGFFRGINKAALISIVASIVLLPLIYCSMSVISKRAFKEEEKLSFMEALKEGSQYYFRYLILGLIIFAITLGLSMGMVLLVFAGPLAAIVPLLFIIMLAFLITYAACGEYLVYYDVEPGKAVSEGRKIGKKYYLQIVGIVVVIFIIAYIMQILSQGNLIVDLIVSFVTANMQGFFIMYKMNLCHEEFMNNQKVELEKLDN